MSPLHIIVVSIHPSVCFICFILLLAHLLILFVVFSFSASLLWDPQSYPVDDPVCREGEIYEVYDKQKN